MTDLDKLAKSLTKAQRDWVLSPERDISEVTDQAARPEHEWDTLAALNVAEYWTDRLTPLGLALRNHLKGQNDGSMVQRSASQRLPRWSAYCEGRST